MARRTEIENINALAELERFGVKYEAVGDDEVKVVCPVHDDSSPSVNLNTRRNLWICHACKAKGDIVALLAHYGKTDRVTMIADLGSRYDIDAIKEINPKRIEKMHEGIFTAGPLLTALRERGITDLMIRRARLGIHEGRIMIPVYDARGRVVNIRRYLPGAPGAEKMRNIKGYASLRLYQEEQLKEDRIWICGGEMKALVVGSMLASEHIGAVAPTAGEGAWDGRWNEKFKGKQVFVCMDIDNAGLVASRKIAGFLYHYASQVRIVRLPISIDEYPTGDVNDYIGSMGATATDLLACMEEAIAFTPPATEDEVDETAEAIEMHLADTVSTENIGRRVRFGAVPIASDTNPFLVAKRVGVSCNRDQPFCTLCPIKSLDADPDTGFAEMNIPSLSRGILEMVNNPKAKQREAVMASLGVPFQCRECILSVKDYHQVYDLRLSPQINLTSEDSENIVLPAFAVDEEPELNADYEFTGTIYPHPKTQQAVLLLDKIEEAGDTLNTFAPHESELEELVLFQPEDWSQASIEKKLSCIYDDLSQNVTRIYGRPDLHFVIDLTYHAPILFHLEERLTSGWVNTLIIGDSSQGKSETTIHLMQHYGLGERVDCKNASVPGLLGGLQQMNGRWFVSWGVVPQHDRRLVALEELKGAHTDVIGKLTDMRSSGVAEIPKIERRKAHARTRLIMISNPRSAKPMSSYNFGVEAIRELIGSLEDIRRFDCAIAVSSDQVDPEQINQRRRDSTPITHQYTNELCRRLILWVWTRNEHQTTFDDDAVDALLSWSTKFCEEYSEALPLIDRGTMRLKLARLAASVAGRTFSCTEDQLSIRVRKSHVDTIAGFLDRIYSDTALGYRSYSEAQIELNTLRDLPLLKKQIFGSRFPADLVSQFLYRDQITLTDLQDWAGLDRDGAQMMMSLFVRKHGLYRVRQWYEKTPAFILFLKLLEKEGIPDKSQEDPHDKF